MTSTQLLKVCRKADPKRSYNAESNHWQHDFDQEPRIPVQTLYVLPGFEGKSCTKFDGPTWEDCAREFLAALQAERESATPTA